MSDFQAIQQRALEIREKYSSLNAEHGHQKWDVKAFTMGFIGDVGDLMKLVMVKENYRTLSGVDDVDAKLRHQLSDCLWSLFTIANAYGIDLESAFQDTMKELDVRIDRGQE